MNLKLSTAAGLLLAVFAAEAFPQDKVPANAPPAQPPAAREAMDPNVLAHVSKVHLAYVTSPSQQVNDDTQKGLENLKEILTARTTVMPEGVVGVDIARDTLACFPFIYWPVTRDTEPLSIEGQKKLQNYMSTGGVVLIDVCDQSLTLDNQGLRRILGGVSIKPLTALPEEHSLKKSFYLVTSLPGSSDFGTVWVEKPDPKRKENVSAVIVGENNWASAWAGKTVADGSREQEMAYRAGVNLIMFAMTGNYKTDQVHTPSILQRLEK